MYCHDQANDTVVLHSIQWDRQPYLTKSGVTDGYSASQKHGMADASILKAHDTITRNFFINGYNGVWTIDHDDGSQYFNDTGNFMVFGRYCTFFVACCASVGGNSP